MGLLGKIGKGVGKVAGISPFGVGGKYGPIALGKSIAKWGGKKSAGATGVDSLIDQQMGARSPFSASMGDIRSRRDQARSRSDDLFGRAMSGYNRFMDDSGGLDPARIKNIEGDISGFRAIGRHGAADEAGAKRIRGGGVFDEFAKTGGYSDADKVNIRTRATSVIPSFFSSLKSNLSRQNAAQGGFNPGYAAQVAKLAREAGQQSQSAALDAELGIMDRVNEGRRWGSSSMSDAEKSIVANMLSGLKGASDTEMGLMDAIRQGQMFGTSGIANLYATPDPTLGFEELLLRGEGMENERLLRLLGLKADRNPNQTNFERYGPMIMSGLSAAGRAFGG